MQTQGSALVNYRNTDVNASADVRNGKKINNKKPNHFLAFALALRLHFTYVYRYLSLVLHLGKRLRLCLRILPSLRSSVNVVCVRRTCEPDLTASTDPKR